MSAAQESTGNENVCVVCFKEVEIFSLGLCNHPVCYECSTRMRVLCRQNECPICRQHLPKVIFTKLKFAFSQLLTQFENTNLQDRKFGILFCSSEIQKAYYKILEHHCYICKDSEKKWPFRTFQQLQDHMRKEHELYYCDICVDNLKIFTFERRCYTRQELAHHRRKGDPNDTSHRGHPLCEFCDKRFVDNDDLFRHLRKIHHYCHFCDADGKNQYYMNLEDLFAHFEEEHYICREGECRMDPFTSVFRSKIDLQAHVALEHSRNMSKSATKQARTLELEFSLAPRPQVDIRRQNRAARENEEYERMLEHSASHSVQFDPSSSQDFPALAGNNNTVTLRARPPSNSKSFSQSSSNLSRDNFPTLGGAKNSVDTSNSFPTFPKPSSSTANANSSFRTSPKPNPSAASAIMNPFPTLPKPSTSNTFPTLPKSKASNPSASSIVSTGRSNQQKAPQSQKQTGKSKTLKPPSKLEEMDDFPALATCKSNGSTTTFRMNTPNAIAPKVSLVRPNSQPSGIRRDNRHPSFDNFHSGTESFPTLGEPVNVATKPQWVQEKKKKKKAEAKKKAVPAPDLPSNSMEHYPALNAKNTKSGSALDGKVDNKDGKQKKPVEPMRNVEELSSWEKQKSKSTSQNNGDGKKNKNVETKKKEILSSNKEVSKTDYDLNKNKNNKKTESSGQQKKSNSVESETARNSNLNENLVSIKPENPLSNVILNRGNEADAKTDNHMATKPPPGFSVKPPPGFDPSSFPSLASALPVQPGFDQPAFRPPTNFQGRNNKLIKKVIASTSNEAIKEFKTKSDEFRNDILPVEEYYEHCKSILGDNFEDIFPELLVLLPDKRKQQELYSVYNGRNKKNLVVCENCKQVVFTKELSEHYYFHLLDNQFPNLSSNGCQAKTAWSK